MAQELKTMTVSSEEISVLREAIMHAEALGFEEFTEERGWINVIAAHPEITS